MYQLCPNQENGDLANCVKRAADTAFIPFDPANTDYQAYLKWVEEGNTPLPADAGAGTEEAPK